MKGGFFVLFWVGFFHLECFLGKKASFILNGNAGRNGSSGRKK